MRIPHCRFCMVALLAFVFGVVLNVGVAHCQDEPSIAARPLSATPFQLVLPQGHLMGDWGGLRTSLEDQGITPTFSFVMDSLGNVSGGRDQDFTSPGNLGLDLMFDLDKLMGVQGGEFHFSMSQRWGDSLSADHIGNTFTTQQVFGGSTFKLINVEYRQKLYDENIELRFGRMATGDQFLVSPYNCVFMQNGVCGNPVSIFFNAPGMTAYPNATWGATTKLIMTPRTSITAGVFNGDTVIRRKNRHGADFSFDGPAFVIMEAAYQANGLEGDRGLLGNYRLGAWYDDHSYDNFNSLGPGLTPSQKSGNWGYYGLFDQVLVRWGDPSSNRGFGVTGSALVSPDDSISHMPYFFTAGFVARGISASRPTDIAGFAIITGKYGGDLRASQRRQGLPVQRTETVYEFTYRFKYLDDALFLQPDVQFIDRPGGTGDITDAWACGMQVGVNF